MIFKSEHITQASGSIGGVTYARAKGGTLYRRARAIPVNPGTVLQAQVRDSLTALVNYWTETLTPSQREAWNTYGQNVPVTNKLGSAIHLSGQNWFIANNTPGLQAAAKGLANASIIAAAPTIYDRGDFTTPSNPTLDDGDGFSVSFTNTDNWAATSGGLMFIYMGRPRNPSRSFFGGPYRLMAVIEGDTSEPPTSPFTVSASNVGNEAFPLIEGQMVRIEVAVRQVDGRLSTRRTLGDVVVTST